MGTPFKTSKYKHEVRGTGDSHKSSTSARDSTEKSAATPLDLLHVSENALGKDSLLIDVVDQYSTTNFTHGLMLKG